MRSLPKKKKKYTCWDNYSVLHQDGLLQRHWEVINDGKITLLFPRMTTLTTHKWHICQSTSHKYSFFIANLFSKPLNCGVQGPTTMEFMKRFYFSDSVDFFSPFPSLQYTKLWKETLKNRLWLLLSVCLSGFIYSSNPLSHFFHFFFFLIWSVDPIPSPLHNWHWKWNIFQLK